MATDWFDRRAVLGIAGVGVTSTLLPGASAAASFLPTTLATSIRSLLSGPGQAAHDAAEDDAFFVVSAADYVAVASGLEGAAIAGLTDGELSTSMTVNDRFGSDAATLPTEIGTVAAGSTIIGYARRVHWSSTITSALMVGSSHLGSYARVGSATTHAATDSVVHLLRRGGSAEQGVRYVALLNPTYTLNGSVRTGGSGMHYAVAATVDGATPPWYAFGSELPMLQVLVHVP